MKLSKLLKPLEIKEIIGNANLEISNITQNSLEVTKNSLFFAIKGNNLDGNDYLNEAIEKGAIAIVTNTPKKVNVTQVIVNDVRDCISKITYEFFSLSKINMKFIGVVGTNGKTTTSYVLRSILLKAGKKVGIIGTSGVIYGKKNVSADLTTPDSISLGEIISDMNKDGIEYVVMELSAHAIEQKRADFIKFESLIFTNCTEDHLDYFLDINEYANVKKSVFLNKKCKFAVVNVDDKVGLSLINTKNLNAYTYGIENPSDVFSIDVKNVDDGVIFDMNLFDEILNLKFSLIGRFNVYNCMAAATVAYKLGIGINDIKEGIEGLKCVDGRMEFVEKFNGAKIFIDYAHTPDGLENTLKELKKITDKKLIVLFGCGGNREKEKRAKMGIIAGKYADFSIITTDNPRFEEPFTIIKEIESGIRTVSLNYITIQNRYIATGYALEMLEKGDTLLLAGKGAECYQDIMGVKSKYSDKDTVMDIISKIRLSGELI
ncbi:MAG: UDP-N-acetylmuramoyl-L-alanyl-D-glutamate--2,6-diaminopimelate ligase [Clostridia bacterium]|nr:UDP-N-acetylmuramoyl-L-alanyl-D-glutamate--2,6-diaminopimelate ligase [Clostridia bacterium]